MLAESNKNDQLILYLAQLAIVMFRRDENHIAMTDGELVAVFGPQPAKPYSLMMEADRENRVTHLYLIDRSDDNANSTGS